MNKFKVGDRVKNRSNLIGTVVQTGIDWDGYGTKASRIKFDGYTTTNVWQDGNLELIPTFDMDAFYNYVHTYHSTILKSFALAGVFSMTDEDEIKTKVLETLKKNGWNNAQVTFCHRFNWGPKTKTIKFEVEVEVESTDNFRDLDFDVTGSMAGTANYIASRVRSAYNENRPKETVVNVSVKQPTFVN